MTDAGGARMLERIPGILRWQDDEGALALVSAQYAQCLYQRLQQCLSRAANTESASVRGLATALDVLDDGALFGMLSSPLCVHALYFERRASRVASMLGDWLQGQAVGGEERWAVPIPGAIAVELRGPHLGPAVSDAAMAPVPAGDAHAVVGKLAAAALAIRGAVPRAGDVLGAFLRVVTPIRRQGARQRVSAWSTPRYLGLAVVRNLHLAPVGAPDVIDVLLHHAAATLVRAVALRSPILAQPPHQAARRRVRSPWTGAALDPPRLVHATAAWFARWWFWQRARGSHHVQAQDCEARAAHARSGFAAGPLADRLKPVREGLDPAALALVAALQDEVLAS